MSRPQSEVSKATIEKINLKKKARLKRKKVMTKRKKADKAAKLV